MRSPLLPSIFIVLILVYISCKRTSPPFLKIEEIPGDYVYSIAEHNDSIYFSTQRGEIYRFQNGNRQSLYKIGKKRSQPLRTILFKNDDRLFASSYETGVQVVKEDTLLPVPHLWCAAWAMKLDAHDDLWFAGRQGVFREYNDTLLRFTDLREAYDVDFYNGFLAVAHRQGVTLYDTSTGSSTATFCKGVICWSVDVFDSLMVVGGVEMCALIRGNHCTTIPIGPKYTIPWAAAEDASGTIYLATQKGLYAVVSGTAKAQCIAYRGKCIKSVFINHKNHLLIGTYFQK